MLGLRYDTKKLFHMTSDKMCYQYRGGLAYGQGGQLPIPKFLVSLILGKGEEMRNIIRS